MTALFRSLLFVPGDSEKKIARGSSSPADGLVLDLEDSVSAVRKSVARQMTADYLASHSERTLSLWVRVNPLNSPEFLEDLAAVVRGRPTGLLLPKADGPADIVKLGHQLDILEVREGIPLGSISIMPVATETARAPFSLGAYRDYVLPRLFGLTWGAEDLSSAVGAATNVDDDGSLSLTYRMVRSLTLLAAKASGVEAIDTVYPDFRDIDGLRRTSIASRREGFLGRFAIHPDQIEPINEAYSPSADDIAFAQRVVDAFSAAPDVGIVGLDGKMLDRPHHLQALKVLALRDAFAARAQ